ncbi:hypothetical protein K431DRAFT_325500 [Polychaeton citri CBS 116435]|uniref:Amino acid transporter transmembrane domain-containing protein n=1 Tax=Polychaeton citri CBS 116435 TaxID=1314669 RepID=A0A9P4QEL2_9PEZI|nr:hypothetical protein K431DRAFT_325500 [Polychaeton citri CBS 116435]
MTWWQACAIMIAETTNLGILSLPSVLATIGMVGGLILIVGLGILATYTGYVLSQFKAAYPHMNNMADVGEILCAPLGFPRVEREISSAAQIIFLVFTMGSHTLTRTRFFVAFDTVTGHDTCSIVWEVVVMIVLFIYTLPRTLKKVSYMSVISFISIISAVMITMIGVGMEEPDPHVQAVRNISFLKAFLSVTNIIFAYAGHVSFFSFIIELKNPHDFSKALFLLQTCDTTMYIVVAVVIYRYTGPDVASPTLGSASKVVSKVAWGTALPTIVLADIVYAHVAAKYIYVRMFRGTDVMSKRNFKSVGVGVIITAILWIIT